MNYLLDTNVCIRFKFPVLILQCSFQIVLQNLIQFRHSIDADSSLKYDPVWEKSYMVSGDLISMVPYRDEYNTEMIRQLLFEKELHQFFVLSA